MRPKHMEPGRNELLTEVLVSAPNAFDKNYTIMFSGWNVELHPDGTFTANDTGGILENSVDKP